MEVAHTLAVDGYIKANSYNTNSHANAASGGSAGSLYIQTHNFTGQSACTLLLGPLMLGFLHNI